MQKLLKQKQKKNRNGMQVSYHPEKEGVPILLTSPHFVLWMLKL